MNPHAPRFITLEGIEGVGKTTAVACVQAWFEARGDTVLTTREPGGTPLGEGVRGLLLDPAHEDMVPAAELLLVFAARAQHLERCILPALTRGEMVICDRFTDATYAYQGYGRGLPLTLIAATEALVHPDLQPGLTLLLDAPVERALARARARGEADRFERERVEFFARVRTGYLARATGDTRFVVIDADQPIDKVHAAIRQALAGRYP